MGKSKKAEIERRRKRLGKNKLKRKNAIRKLVFEYLKDNPCADCNESNHILLQFDHVRGKKKANISDMIRNDLSWKTILSEIKKCEVVCANCHCLRTSVQQKWYSTCEET